jgi:hypothetical protein
MQVAEDSLSIPPPGLNSSAERVSDGLLLRLHPESESLIREYSRRPAALTLLDLADRTLGTSQTSALRLLTDCLLWCLATLGEDQETNVGSPCARSNCYPTP